jgi:hypothetical protein
MVSQLHASRATWSRTDATTDRHWTISGCRRRRRAMCDRHDGAASDGRHGRSLLARM